jgi:N-acetylmuramoyl-L-alanine amidase
VLKNTKMSAVLMEYGFMDSKTDAPVILTEEYAKLVGYATMEAIAKVAGLQKKAVSNLRYAVQTGVFSSEENARWQVQQLKKAGFDAIIKKVS